ncbi:MAG: MobA/MobL family protein [Methylococcales bacterium]|nr:MobA/MobL family protein [Methylococcales bacterium]
MPAIAYHFSAKTVSRSRGQSAVAAVSYRTAEKLKDERLDKTFDYTRKQGVELVYHAAPKATPDWTQDIGQSWNEVERVENRKNSTLAREYVAAFPHELTEQQREFILKDFIREEFTRKGFMATAAIHSPAPDGDERNYHVHILFSERPLDESGFAKNKDRRFSSYENREETLGHLKEKWAELGARQLERAGHDIEAARWRHGHETLEKQQAAALARGDNDYAEQCDREASKHLGVTATAIEREGKASERGDLNRDIESRNTERQEIKAELASIEQQQAKLEAEPESPAPRSLDEYGQRMAARRANPNRDYTALHETHAQVAARLKESHAAPKGITPESTVAREAAQTEADRNRGERLRRLLEEQAQKKARDRGGHER